MHLTTTNPVSWVWRQNTRAGVIPAISFTRLSRRNARISAHVMRMRAFSRMRCECAHAMRMLAHAHISPHAMRCEWAHAMRCAHQGGTYACPVLYNTQTAKRLVEISSAILNDIVRNLFEYKDVIYTSMGNPVVEIRRSKDHLISTMGFPILVRMSPWYWIRAHVTKVIRNHDR